MPTEIQQIATEYAAAKGSFVETVRHLHRCGVLLNAQKKTIAHGEWLAWLRTNENTLGFDVWKAERMMKLANSRLTKNLTQQKALTLSRELWGNAPKPKLHGRNGKSKTNRNPGRRAELMAQGFSRTSAGRIGYVEKNGIPELIAAIEAKKITPWQGRDIARLSKAEQAVALRGQNITDGPLDTPEIFWRRGIMNRAAESIGHALFDDSWELFSVDQELIDACLAVAEAWETTAAHLQNLFNEQEEVK